MPNPLLGTIDPFYQWGRTLKPFQHVALALVCYKACNNALSVGLPNAAPRLLQSLVNKRIPSDVKMLAAGLKLEVPLGE